MKAIETVYKGWKFRSRIEARWGVFFDALGIKWEYEREGFDLNGTWYLPDFWLPEQNCWIEIKGQSPTEEELHKCELLARAHCRKDVYVFAGSIPLPPEEKLNARGYYFDCHNTSNYPSLGLRNGMEWCECPHCGIHGLSCMGCYSDLPCKCLSDRDFDQALLALQSYAGIFAPRKSHLPPSWWGNKMDQFMYTGDTPLLITAYTAARQARFEYR